MPYTQSDLDAVRRAIASGALRVRFESGTTVQETVYRSIDDLRKAEAEIAAALNASTGGRRKQFYGVACKGL